ncbi:MAG: hypothetical protein ACK5YE_03790, partial [Planctomyces sp.]
VLAGNFPGVRERLGQSLCCELSGFEVDYGGTKFLFGIFVLLLHSLLAHRGGVFGDLQSDDPRVG